MSEFDPRQIIDDDAWAALVELRVGDPEAIRRHARQRPRRKTPAPDGRLVILAADHPARMVVDVQGEDGRMGDRRDYLARILRVLQRGHVDGVMGTPDIIEELTGLDLLATRRGAESVLDQRVLVGCMNRGGLRGAAFEMDDRFTAYDAAALAAMNLDGGKMMVRLDLADPTSLSTLEACASGEWPGGVRRGLRGGADRRRLPYRPYAARANAGGLCGGGGGRQLAAHVAQAPVL